MVYKAGRNELAIFVELMKETGERDGFLTRDITYFESMYDHLNPHGHMELFLVKLIPEDVSASLQEDLMKVEKDIEKAARKKTAAKRKTS